MSDLNIVPPDMSFVEVKQEKPQSQIDVEKTGGILEYNMSIALPRAEWQEVMSISVPEDVAVTDTGVELIALNPTRLKELNQDNTPVFSTMMAIVSRLIGYLVYKGEHSSIKLVVPVRLNDAYTHATLSVYVTIDDEYIR